MNALRKIPEGQRFTSSRSRPSSNPMLIFVVSAMDLRSIFLRSRSWRSLAPKVSFIDHTLSVRCGIGPLKEVYSTELGCAPRSLWRGGPARCGRDRTGARVPICFPRFKQNTTRRPGFMRVSSVHLHSCNQRSRRNFETSPFLSLPQSTWLAMAWRQDVLPNLASPYTSCVDRFRLRKFGAKRAHFSWRFVSELEIGGWHHDQRNRWSADPKDLREDRRPRGDVRCERCVSRRKPRGRQLVRSPHRHLRRGTPPGARFVVFGAAARIADSRRVRPGGVRPDVSRHRTAAALDHRTIARRSDDRHAI